MATCRARGAFALLLLAAATACGSTATAPGRSVDTADEIPGNISGQPDIEPGLSVDVPGPATAGVPRAPESAVDSVEPGPAARATRSAAGPQTPDQGGTNRPRPRASSAVGVTAGAIKIGFIDVVNNDQLVASFGVQGADIGSSRAQIDAVVADLNARGGIFGRKIEPVIATFDSYSSETSAQQYESICAKFTQDNKVFAVLAPWNESPGFAECLRKARTLYITDGLLQLDAETFAALSPYVYTGLFSVSRGAVALADGLVTQGFFGRNTKTGIVRFDTPEYKRVADRYFKPVLAAAGVQVAAEAAIRRGNISNQMADVNSAVLKFKTEQVDRVVFLTAAGGTAIFFMSQAESQSYRPRYGLASPDAPSVLAQNLPASQLSGAMGSGWLPGIDVADAQGPPLTPAEKRCLAVHAKNGTSYATRNSAITALAFCDLMWLFERAARAAGPDLTTARWTDGISAMGARHETPYTFATAFVRGRADGATRYRPLAYDDACECFRYTSAARAVQ
ncbi:MAG TPA: ABC transporter substrate-binding protein [Mycobacteriales bacterium]|nr:ABC transporter substrate-binding protein [Mycobacteriales bacterium]